MKESLFLMWVGMKKRFIFSLITVFVLSLGIYYLYAKDRDAAYPRNWQGALSGRLNFRDLGQSLNQCLQQDVFEEGLIFRANKNFTGWSCNQIQNPKTIYSLNYDPEKPQQYFCEEDNGQILVGKHFNETFVIKDIIDLKNWEDPEFKDTMCTFLQDTVADLANRRKFLYHCDAGRDRTGALSAILAMIAAEEQNLDRTEVINAIECDYRKTSTLEEEKKGLMKTFLTHMQSQGGVSHFVETTCRIPKQTLVDASAAFVKKSPSSRMMSSR
jgi:hypothetical protein